MPLLRAPKIGVIRDMLPKTINLLMYLLSLRSVEAHMPVKITSLLGIKTGTMLNKWTVKQIVEASYCSAETQTGKPHRTSRPSANMFGSIAESSQPGTRSRS